MKKVSVVYLGIDKRQIVCLCLSYFKCTYISVVISKISFFKIVVYNLIRG